MGILPLKEQGVNNNKYHLYEIFTSDIFIYRFKMNIYTIDLHITLLK